MISPWSISAILLLLATGRMSAAAEIQVVGHVRINSLERFSARLGALYDAIGMGGRLYPRQRIEAELGRRFPAPGLEGLDRNGVFGFVWLLEDSGKLLWVPFCRLADRQSFVAAVKVHSNQAREPGSDLRLLAVQGGTLLLPGEELAALVSAYAERVGLFDPDESAADLSLSVSFSSLLEHRRKSVDHKISFLRGLTNFGMGESARELVHRWTTLIEEGLDLVAQWHRLEFALRFVDGGVRVTGLLEPVPDSPSARWLLASRPLPAAGLPALCDRPAATLQIGNGSQGLLSLLRDGLDDPVLTDILAGAIGELCISLDSARPTPTVLVLSACEDVDRLGRIIESSGPGGETPNSIPVSILEGRSDADGWATARAGNWMLLALGEDSRPAVSAGLRHLQRPRSSGDGPAADPEVRTIRQHAVARLDVWPQEAFAFLLGRQALDEARPVAARSTPLTLQMWPAGNGLRFEFDLPDAALTECVPMLEIR